MEPLSFVTSWNTVSKESKSLCHFHVFVFLGVHFTAFGVLEHFMNAVSVCIAGTQSLSCVLFTFCIMGLNFYWSKKWYELVTSCNVFCMQAWHFRNFQIRPSLCSLCHYQSIHNKEFERNLLHLHIAASCLSLSESSLGIHSMFSLFLLALYLLWDNFLIS